MDQTVARERPRHLRRLILCVWVGAIAVMLEAGNANVAAARAAGIRLVAGSDYSSLGFLALHWELELLVAAGLTPAEAIATATRNAALTLGIADDLGSVRAGALADLVVLDEDPLEDIRNTQRIYMVVKQGRIVDREALLRSSLEQRQTHLRPWVAQARLWKLNDHGTDLGGRAQAGCPFHPGWRIPDS